MGAGQGTIRPAVSGCLCQTGQGSLKNQKGRLKPVGRIPVSDSRPQGGIKAA